MYFAYRPMLQMTEQKFSVVGFEILYAGINGAIGMSKAPDIAKVSVKGSFHLLWGLVISTIISAVGNYAIASTFVVLITFFATPITTMLFPAFSKLELRRDYKAMKSVYQFSVKYAALLVVPVVAIVMALSESAISTLFGNKYASAPLFLSLLAISYACTALGSLSVTNLISGQGKTGFVLKLNILSAAVGFPLSLILARQFGVIGIIITTLTAGLPSLIVALHWVKKNYKLSIDWSSSFKVLLTSALAGAVAYILQRQLNFISVINLTIGLVAFLVVFLPGILITRTISKSDIDNLRAIMTSLGPVSRLLTRH
jgi:O-antigen/teichoic acid export membrane protein